MKAFFLALACSGAILAQTVTTVAQTIVNPDGTPASGQATLRINGSCASESDYVGEETIVQKFTAGAFSVNLVSNDGGCLGTDYLVSWQLNGGPTWQETWVVPYSATHLTVDSVKIPSAVLGSPAWTRGAFAINITQPLVTDDGLFQYLDPYPYGIASVLCSTDSGSVTINLDVRPASTPNAPGAVVLPAALVCTSTGTASSVLSPAVSVPGGSPLAVDVLAVNGTPNVVRIFVSKLAQ
jgi:hypothetical protein